MYLLYFPVKTNMGKALLANAITLTPGTITVALEDSEFTVHCLDDNIIGLALTLLYII